jgi:phosphatidate cytidylyltransferase
LNELITRSLTGLLFVAVVIGSVYIHLIAFGAVFLFFSFLALKEFYRLNSPQVSRPFVVSGLVSGTGIFLVVLLHYILDPPLPFLLLIILLLAYIPLAGFFSPDRILMNLIITYSGITYIILPFTLLFLLLHTGIPAGTYDQDLYTGFFILLWSFDTGAYVSGRLLGKNKMAPVTSPGKTWEGFAGGVAIAAAACYFVGRGFEVMRLPDWYMSLLIIIVSGTLGDLFESRLKRKAGVKNSGNILPGHGGILDRFDSVFFSVPCVTLFYFVRYIFI